MSATADRESKDVRRSCERCRLRKARFRHRGHVKADRDHTLCFECYRAERERRRAMVLLDGPEPATPFSLLGHQAERRPLDSRRIAHRRRMLECLQGQVSRLARSAQGV